MSFREKYKIMEIKTILQCISGYIIWRMAQKKQPTNWADCFAYSLVSQ